MGLTKEQLDVIQGDIWSKGFPKYHEAYYFFSIAKGTADVTQFARCLRDLVTKHTGLISTLSKVKTDQDAIFAEQEKARAESRPAETLCMANALIAFTSKGLETIQTGLFKKGDLDLEKLSMTDPAFLEGMMSPNVKEALGDPERATLEPPFKGPDDIHGLLKIGGSSKTEVDKRLQQIQEVLKHGTLMLDMPGKTSRIDGWTRPEPFRGKEHFGFEDGISQPLMDGIDAEPTVSAAKAVSMVTEPEFIIVTPKTLAVNVDTKRPDWMMNGSFLVFRKLEQNVKAFKDLTKEFGTYGLKSPDHMGAKLMGRWPSGAPIALQDFNIRDSENKETAKHINNFSYVDEVCPAAAHIRKTNPRRDFPPQSGDANVRIIRNGIPYGFDYKAGDKSKRGLLFACYQSRIEQGFQHMQQAWSNTITFPNENTGLDPIIGQGERPAKTSITDMAMAVAPPQLVTLKGGDYFFVPSIDAMKGDLTDTVPESKVKT